MNSFSIFCIFFMIIAAIKADHEIPCTFTAKIALHAKYGGKNYVFNYTQYSIKDSAMAQEGLVPQGYPVASSKVIYKTPNYYTVIDPMFDDHMACAVLPVSYSEFPCFEMDFDAQLDSSNITCPKSSVYYNSTQRCDRWKYRDILEAYVTWYFLADTFIPVQYEYDGDYYELYDFISFDSNKPDPKAFEPPKGVECNNLMDDNAQTSVLDTSASRFAGFRGAVVNAPSSEQALINDQASIAEINKKAKTWKAAPSSVFNGMTHSEAARRMLRAPTPMALGDNENLRKRSLVSTKQPVYDVKDIPESFDASKQWPKCGIEVPRDQGNCGSCWAFGSTISLGNRFCIARNNSAPVQLSPQYAVSCFHNLYGCDGGYTDLAWIDLKDIGTVEESCCQYEERDRSCPTKCDDGSSINVYKAKDAYTLYTLGDHKSTMEKIQKDILTNGPVEAAFWVFEDFFSYSSGVYQRTPGSSFAGGHAVKIFGWGVDKDTKLPYWLVANSWGEDWGEKGLFRILRGSNECSIEDEIAAGLPRIK